MQILFTIRYFYPFIGGTEKQALALASQLVHKGVKVTIVTSRFEMRWPKQEIMNKVEVIRLLSPRVKILGAIVFLCCLAGYLIKNSKKFCLIHTFQIGYTSSLSILMAILLGKPSVIKLASSGAGGDVQRAQRTWWGKCFLAVARKATRIICVTTTIEKELLSAHFEPSRLRTIANGVDLKEFTVLREKSQLRKKLGVSDTRTIVYTGRLSPEKGVDLLIRSFARVREDRECQLIIIADGPERANIDRLVAQYQLSASVVLLQHLTDVAGYLHASDIFVLPSRFEGLSNAMLEAMACGLPVVSTQVGGSLDIIEDGVNGLLIEVNDEEQLAQAVVKVLSDSLFAVRLGDNARRTVEMHHDLQRIADKYLSLFEQLCTK